jgi:hypothetical protein
MTDIARVFNLFSGCSNTIALKSYSCPLRYQKPNIYENKMKNNATHGRFIAAISQAEGEFEVRLRKRILHAF